ncbi:MAG: plasmid stabilization protein [Bryobacteraceae bacterium]
MASILIRDLGERTKQRLRTRAASHGRSMEAEARDILEKGLSEKPSEARGLASAIRKIVEPIGGFELDIPAREPIPERFDFSDTDYGSSE